jgi:hypothetical protein
VEPSQSAAAGAARLAAIVQSQNGKPRQLYVPKEWEDRVRRAVTDYQELQNLVEEISELEWKCLEERKE